MQIRWSPEAADSFVAICKYIREDNPSAAKKVANSIFSSVTSLANLPQRGRLGKIAGTRELVLTPLPYIVVYRVVQSAVEVLRIVHGAQQWPPVPGSTDSRP